jgi:mono/diheme cytochrome c family protein
LLTILGYYGTPGLPQEATPQGGSAAPARASTAPASTRTAPSSPQAVEEGKKVFAANACGACHAVEGKANLLGPGLQNEAHAGRSPEWLREQIRAPRSHSPDSVMPAYTSLTPRQLDDLVAYMMSLSTGVASQPGSSPALPSTRPSAATTSAGAEPPLPPPGQQGPPGLAARMIGNADLGRHLYGQFCLYCHGKDGAGGIANPGSAAQVVLPLRPIDRALFSKEPLNFAENIDRYIQHGSASPGPSPAMDMPAFGSTHALTQQQIANLEAYALQINGVDRAEIMDPGVSPARFALLTAAVFAAIGAGLSLAAWASRRRTRSRARGDSPARSP